MGLGQDGPGVGSPKHVELPEDHHHQPKALAIGRLANVI